MLPSPHVMTALFFLAAVAAAPVHQYALIVGNNASLDDGVPSLRFADDDAARFYEFLAPRAEGVRLLTVLDAESQRIFPELAKRAGAPKRADLEQAFAALNDAMAADRKAGVETVFFFVFTGHGRRDAAGEGSISLLDGDFTRAELYAQILARAQATWVHLIVDACDSYFFVNSRGGPLPSAPPATAAVERLAAETSLDRFPNVGVLLSTASEQESHEWQAIRAGVFSHEVRSALAGAADVNSDGRVEYAELAAFVAAANARVADPRGRVALTSRPPPLNRGQPLVDLSTRSQGEAYVLLPAKLGGHVWLEDDRGVRTVELNKERGVAVLLGLPPRPHYYLRSAKEEAHFVGTASTLVDGAALRFEPLALAARGALGDAFRRELFAEPYGPRFFRGFTASGGAEGGPRP